MTHRRALLGMLVVTLLWSTAGLVSRQLEAARSFEVTFWRSFFTAVTLALYFAATQGRGAIRLFRAGGRPLLVSGLMWCAMFTCFMVALMLTTVANVLITMSLSPLFTALLARFLIGSPVARRTWVAIVLAGAGIAWMYGHAISTDPGALVGTLVALGVPLAAAINWNLLQRSGIGADMVPALLIGAVLSCLLTLPFAFPMQATPADLGWLAGLGILQLAVPCVLAVRLARHLPAPEISLLALLEVVFGIAWAWVGAGERPAPQVLVGGCLVLLTLLVNELIGLKTKRTA